MSITITFGVIVMLLLLSSCGGKKKAMGEAITERDSLPMMTTLGVTTLISDSGVTRYRVNTEEWSVYDRKKPSYWAFEKGVYLEQFDSIFHIEASIKADTAYYYDKERLWKLIGNVDIQNRKGERFNTELLYWNEATQKVYSDKYMEDYYKQFTFDDKARMLSVVVHDNLDGDSLFVGHVGVLVPTTDGYLFVEKLTFEEPYQAIKFASKKDCYKYLTTKYKTP